MKQLFSLLLLLLFGYGVTAQTSELNTDPVPPKYYLGVGSGFDNYAGTFGVSGNLRLKDKIFLQSGLGVGGWGGKMSLGLRFDTDYLKGWSYGIGFSHATGLKQFAVNMEAAYGGEAPMIFVLNPANTINLKTGYYFKSRKRNNFYLEGGYAIPLQLQPWELLAGPEMSKQSEQIMNILAPGGLIVGLGYNFGL